MELKVGARQRSFTIHLPRRVDRPAPLAIVLHGSQGSGDAMREWTSFDQQGFAVAYPDGCEGSWADGRGVTDAETAGVDDVVFLRTLIEWAAEHHGTAPDQTVVAGISNGAFMAHRLALEASDQVAVLAAVAGGLPAAISDLQPTHAVSAMLIHGTADQLSPIEGGHSRRRGPNGELRGRTLSLPETAERWRAIDQCPPGPTQTRTTELSSRVAYERGVGGTRIVAWTVFGGGHSWPGAAVRPEWNEPVTQEFDAAREICRFAEPLLAGADRRRL